MSNDASQRWGVQTGTAGTGGVKYSKRTTKDGQRSRAVRRATTVPLTVLARMSPEEAEAYVRRSKHAEP